MNEENLIYLDTYVLQQDMRIRMPKSIIENMNAKKGETQFKIFYDRKENHAAICRRSKTFCSRGNEM